MGASRGVLTQAAPGGCAGQERNFPGGEEAVRGKDGLLVDAPGRLTV
jgi:hypothetical protein